MYLIIKLYMSGKAFNSALLCFIFLFFLNPYAFADIYSCLAYHVRWHSGMPTNSVHGLILFSKIFKKPFVTSQYPSKCTNPFIKLRFDTKSEFQLSAKKLLKA